jgi:tripartite-type tricarboxylate transporter receptor subunit TctC
VADDFTPAGTPRPIVDRLHNAVARILRGPEMQERLVQLGMQGADMSIEPVAAFQKAEVAEWAAAVIESANVNPE